MRIAKNHSALYGRNVAIAFVMTVFTFIAMTPQYGHAQAGKSLYGKVTPSNVFELNTSMLKSIRFYAQKKQPNKFALIESMKANAVAGKTPADAFSKINYLGELVDKVRVKEGLSRTSKIRQKGKKLVPAEVFIMTGIVLDGFVSYIHKVDPESSLGDIYTIEKVTVKKSPSDVFALVDLSIRMMIQLFPYLA